MGRNTHLSAALLSLRDTSLRPPAPPGGMTLGEPSGGVQRARPAGPRVLPCAVAWPNSSQVIVLSENASPQARVAVFVPGAYDDILGV